MNWKKQLEKPLQKETTRVKVSLRFVKNLGNYQSIHVDLGIEDFVRDIDQNTDAAIDRVYKLVEEKLVEKVNEIEESLDK